jgi:hypothetical protein
MRTIHFSVTAPYRSLSGFGLLPLLDVTLFMGRSQVSTVGLLDSGAQTTVFGLDVADALGISDVREGRAVTGVTLAGPVAFYLFDVEMEVRLAEFRQRFPAQVGFYPARGSRNLLGRNLLFSHFLIGFSESRQETYLRPDD